MISRRHMHGILFLAVLFVIVTQPFKGVPPLMAQTPEIDPVRELMLRMPSAMKVGQLALVSFPGSELNDNSEIVQLIRQYSVGGVLFTRENGNFSLDRIQSSALFSTTTYLQNVALSSSQSITLFTDLESEAPFQVPVLPLLIAARPSSIGIPPTAYVTGAAKLPTPLALGATWNPTLATASGEVLGRELSALGFNLYLGPDLDVLYTPSPGDPADLGTRVFGADPFWVGEMGSAYIQGLHLGSEGGLLVAPRHLPGLGSADRSLDEEVPTVQKPLELLKQIELAPFFAAATSDPSSENSADAFLVTHIKYRGFQGNIRDTTRPISLDAHALQLVYSLDEMVSWRSAGGVLIADNLGLPAVHLSYDPRGVTFNGRRVAQDALTAGNDLLVFDMFTSDGNWNSHYTNIRDTLEYLTSRYENDPAFKVVVDAALYRVLSMKYRIESKYRISAIGTIIYDGPDISTLGESGELNSQVALEALTRISPLTDDLLPSSPLETDRIVIFTQELFAQETPELESIPLLTQTEIADALFQFYGPEGTGVVQFADVRSFTFSDLNRALDLYERQIVVTPTPVPTPEGETPSEEVTPLSIEELVLSALQDAQWIVFASSGLANGIDGYALKRFLSTQANIVDARLVVFSFGPPYELDSTEVSKLDLFYTVYSPGKAFVDTAARALFSDLVSPGSSPVDVPAVNYYLPTQTMPDPVQVLSLFLVNDAGEELTPTTRSNITINDVINLRTGIIVDRNGHTVPDHTPVEFYLSYPQEGIEQTHAAEAQGGVAQTLVTLDRVGQLHITVKSEPAVASLRLELTIRDDGVTITEVEPTPTQTATPRPTLTPSPTPTPIPTRVIPDDHKLPERISLPEIPRFRLLLWGLSGITIMAVIAFLWYRDQSVPPDDTLRFVLWGIIIGSASYLVVVISLRWVWPALSYALINREYMFGIVSAVGSVAVFVMRNTVFPNTNQRNHN